MPYSQSELEHVYAKEEATWGVIASPIAGTDAFKVVRPGPALKATQEVIRGNEKTGARSQGPSLPCGSIAGTCDLNMYVEPSGTAGTKPDGAVVYKNLMGKETIVTTTVTSAASGSNITLGAVTGIKAGSILGIGAEMRPVASLAGNVATMAAPFSATPSGGAAVKSVMYELAGPVPSSLSVFSFIQELPLVSVGTVFNQGVFSFVDQLIHLALTGLGVDVPNTGLPAEPTPVYTGKPLARGCGSAFLGGVAAQLLDMTVTINNGDVPRDIPIGSKSASGISRGVRTVTDTFLVYLTDVTKAFYDVAKAKTNQSLFIQIGDVVGKIFSINLPQRMLNMPDIDKSKPEVQLSFTAEAWGYADEEMVIAFG